jgi:hypothetical protein
MSQISNAYLVRKYEAGDGCREALLLKVLLKSFNRQLTYF